MFELLEKLLFYYLYFFSKVIPLSVSSAIIDPGNLLANFKLNTLFNLRGNIILVPPLMPRDITSSSLFSCCSSCFHRAHGHDVQLSE